MRIWFPWMFMIQFSILALGICCRAWVKNDKLAVFAKAYILLPMLLSVFTMNAFVRKLAMSVIFAHKITLLPVTLDFSHKSPLTNDDFLGHIRGGIGSFFPESDRKYDTYKSLCLNSSDQVGWQFCALLRQNRTFYQQKPCDELWQDCLPVLHYR